MAEQTAKRDSNRVPTLLGVDSIGFNQTTTVAVDASTHAMLITGTITASPASDGTTGSAVPASASYGGINVAGTLRGLTGVNPSGSIYAAQIDLASVGGTTFALGQALAAASLPVVLTAAQISTLTPLSSVTVTQATGTNLHAVLDTTSTTAVTQATASNLNATVVGTGTFATQSTLAAETTKVIGVTRTADGAGNLLTSNSTTYTAKFGLDSNLLGTLGTAFSTAGKIDVKGADGDVFVRQTTAASLNATVVGTGTFVVQATLAAETTKVIGTINIASAQTLATVTTVSTVTAVTSITNQVDTNLKQVGGTNTVTGGVAGTLAVGGNVATNVAIGTNPINNGAQGVSSENTAVTTGRMVQLVADLVGKLIVLPYSNPENFVSGAITSAMTGTTTTSLIASPGGSLRNYITTIICSNAHATVGTDIIIQDGSGGTTLLTIPAAAVYGGAVITLPTPLRQPTTATAIFCANVTTGASTKVSAVGYKGL